jgi:cathepsin L
MKSALILSLLASASITANAVLSTAGSSYLSRERFEVFKKEHAKLYESIEEEEKRFSIFEEKIESIAKKNAALIELGHDAVHGITRFADLTADEFKFFLGLDRSAIAADMEVLQPSVRTSGATGAFNWNEQGFLTPVKNQAQCGSCWSLSLSKSFSSSSFRLTPSFLVLVVLVGLSQRLKRLNLHGISLGTISSSLLLSS